VDAKGQRLMKYRLGGHHKDTVYLQLGEERSDDDARVAYFFPPNGEEHAEAFVTFMNNLKDWPEETDAGV
jgi:hypothetical protein